MDWCEGLWDAPFQGDRKAGPSLSSFNYESVWGQHALKHMYRAVLEEEVPLVRTEAHERPVLCSGPSNNILMAIQ